MLHLLEEFELVQRAWACKSVVAAAIRKDNMLQLAGLT